MRTLRTASALAIVGTFILTLVVQNSSSAPVSEQSRAEVYKRFHEVLHPLQHEALPQKNFAEIRRQSGELFKRGKAIVGLGIEQAPADLRKEFAKVLRKFDQALNTFSTDAKSGSDDELEKSFSEVHDLYEELEMFVLAAPVPVKS
ncbi:MAG TPA: hypothetical protein VLL54_19240 [Pyrinomonadaceae bacterium]|nr:hypothetical protein [Pyrinomonadaceae bacterium]